MASRKYFRFCIKLCSPSWMIFTSSLESIITPLQWALLWQILNHIDDLDQRVAVLDRMVEQSDPERYR